MRSISSSPRRRPPAGRTSTPRVVALLFCAGRRRAEASALVWADIDPTERPEQLRVRVQTSKTNPTADRATSPHTRRAYAMARRQLDAWLEGRPLDASSLAAYLGHLHEAGRAPATAAMVVATVKRSARDAGTAVPIGPLTRRALEGFRRTDAADAPPRRGQARA